jgi:hypothetical protein
MKDAGRDAGEPIKVAQTFLSVIDFTERHHLGGS